MSVIQIKTYLIGLLVLGTMMVLTSCSPNDMTLQSNGTSVEISKINQTSQPYKIDGFLSPLQYNGEDLKQFTLSQPLPNIWLISPDNEDINGGGSKKINLSEEAKNILYKHWLNSLKHHYITEIEEALKDTSYQKEDALLVQSTHDTKKQLLNTLLEPNVNSRNFSDDEVRQLVMFLRDKSYDLIKEVKKIKEQD